MSEQQANFSRYFIDQQRKRLEELRREVLGAELSATQQRRSYSELHGNEATTFEDAAQDNAIEEVRQAQHDVDDQRIAHIARALQKIDDGTYGFSDLSGNPIPRARLEAVPEAIYTVEEESQRDYRH